MEADSIKPPAAFGFLTVLESPEHGLFGGYLVLSPLGRPLEFRCSTPVRPSRAQEILYGPTLREYLLAEVIGQALLAGSELPVLAILTDQHEILPLASLRSESVLCVSPQRSDHAANNGGASDAAIEFDGYAIEAYQGYKPAVDELRQMLGTLSTHIDLCEPFERVRAALTEAQLAPHDAAGGVDERAAAA